MATAKKNTPEVEVFNQKIEMFNFEITIPKPTESRERTNDTYVRWGSDNLYPNSLLEYYNNSASHGGIVDQKVDFIVGNGPKEVGGEKIDIYVNPCDSIDEFVSKLAFDTVLFGGYAVLVTYNAFPGKPFEYRHVPIHKVRTNNDKSKFWVNDNWKEAARNFVIYDRYKPNDTDTKTKLFWFDAYKPSGNNIYPTPEYNGAIKSILTDIAIADFDYNQIKNHFSPSTMITFFNGANPTPEQVKDTFDGLKKQFTGENGNKLLVNFQSSDGKAPDITSMTAGDWDKAYIALNEKVEDKIFKGHRIVSPMLFANKVAGQLGGTTELKAAEQIFKATYVRNKRNQIQSALNYVFQDSSIISNKIEFADKPLFNEEVSDTTKEKVLTINEFREIMGKPPIGGGDRLITEQAPAAIPAPPSEPKQFSSNTSRSLKEDDYELIKGFGLSSEEFELIEDGEQVFSREDANQVQLKFETAQEIADYILENDLRDFDIKKLRTLIRKDLGINITIDELTGHLNSLSKSGILNVEISDGNAKVKPAEQATPKKVEVMYKYTVRPGMGESVIKNTRAFCKRVIENGKLYTREEIQNMSTLFEYDIFKYSGGYYMDPSTGEATKHCRHDWTAKTVVRKKK